MEAFVVNYRGGVRTQKCNHIILTVTNIEDKKKAESLVGKSVSYMCEGKNKTEIKGKIVSVHGSKGAVRAIFEKGLPGQALGGKVSVN